MAENLDLLNGAVSLLIKAVLLAARFSGRVRKRSLERLAAMDTNAKATRRTFTPPFTLVAFGGSRRLTKGPRTSLVIQIDRLQEHMAVAEQCAGRPSQVDLGDFVIGKRPNLG